MIRKNLTTKNKKILDLANGVIVDHTEASFLTKISSDDGGSHLCVYIDENYCSSYDTRVVGKLINLKFPRLRICSFFVSEEYIETFLR